MRNHLIKATIAALAVGGGLMLTACNPEAGEGRIKLSGAVTANVAGPTVTCRPAGDGGETTTPTWNWNGTIAGESATVSVTGLLPTATVDTALVQIGDDEWIELADPSRVHQVSLDEDDGTVRAEATLQHQFGPLDEPVTITAVLRCPVWPVP